MDKRKLYDVTMTIKEGMISWPSDGPVHVERVRSMIDGDLLVGPTVLIHMPGVQEIGAYQLKNADIPKGTQRLLLKTDNSSLLGRSTFEEKYSYLTLDGARYLVDHQVRLVGIDYLSIGQYGMGEGVHQELLREEVVIIEGLDLREVPAGLYTMTALPLKIAGCDGAPARVILES